MNDSVIKCENLKRYYESNNEGKKIVLDGLNLSVKSGEVYGLVGKNGAGKTTLIKILTNLLYPSSGNVYINGYNVEKEGEKALKKLGVVLSNNRALYLKLTAYENLLFFSRLYGLKEKDLENRISYVLSLVELRDKKDEYVETFSHGMMQRLNIARALLSDPDIFILDEPTNGLDIESTNKLRNIILDLNKQGKTILLTTHSLQEVEILATNMGILKDGKISKEGSPKELITNFPGKVYELMLGDKSDLEKIKIIENILSTKVRIDKSKISNDLVLKFILDANSNIPVLTKKLENLSIDIKSINNVDLDLNDVFMFE
ncbi:ABC transporter ATP-binding protein [Finegoldia magna]|uniref:ABC transporter ATP-binding protein n=1 Tax=Finegoldia magna TaxID=1260 RepID=UPI0012B0E315|nr:ABC transporter ATP-binding protein [Finegoldia magna]MSB16562.1 ATP-binding cassette domain-containing protein [Finegoldia magna]MSD45349.1 ATP-binding cassette domain-containing protein [Finegoldia magna]